ncbi:MAG: DJ-1/PfpI family protein [Oscillospiraceae bacterium]|nr:DJ-1/PfpI family protein [Oscillospiraceae bacterium]
MIYEFLAEGFEELEAIAPLDILRRAGVEVQSVGVGGKTVIGSHGVEVACDIAVEEMDSEACRGVILPGGPGRANLAQSPDVLELLRVVSRRGGMIAAICGAPEILGLHGYLEGKRACCFPGSEKDLLGARVRHDPVVADGNVITSRGAGTSIPFALAIVSYLASPELAGEIAGKMQCP